MGKYFGSISDEGDMTKTEITCRLLKLVIPGDEIKEQLFPEYPCTNCTDMKTIEGMTPETSLFYKFCDLRWNTPACAEFNAYQSECNEIIEKWECIRNFHLIKAIVKHNIKRCFSKRSMYIPKTKEVAIILYRLCDKFSWRQTAKIIVPLIYKRSDATWTTIKVALAISGKYK